MINFETETIYNVITDYIGARNGQLAFEIDEIIEVENDILRPLHVTGLEVSDIAVTMNFILLEDGLPTAYTQGYLVSDVTGSEGIIVPDDLVEHDPKTWITPRLQFLIEHLEPGEFEQFTLPKLSAYIIRRSVA